MDGPIEDYEKVPPILPDDGSPESKTLPLPDGKKDKRSAESKDRPLSESDKAWSLLSYEEREDRRWKVHEEMAPKLLESREIVDYDKYPDLRDQCINFGCLFGDSVYAQLRLKSDTVSDGRAMIEGRDFTAGKSKE